MDPKDLIVAVDARDLDALGQVLGRLTEGFRGLHTPGDGAGGALHRAAGDAWLPGLRRLLAAGADAAGRNREGATPLHLAAVDGRRVEPYASGADGVEPRRRSGRTVPFPKDPHTIRRVVAALHRLGFVPQPIPPSTVRRDPWGRDAMALAEAFHRATWEDAARANLLAELKTDWEDLRREAPELLEHLGRSWPSRELCATLLDAGADLEAKDDRGATPLMVAVGHGAVDLVHFLLERGADPHAETEFGDTPLREAVETGHVEIASTLLEAGALPLDVLAPAAASGDEPMLELLLRRGADPNAASDLAEAPLFAAARYGKSAAVGLLIQAGARPDAVNPYGESPLHLAAGSGGPIEILGRLAELAGVDPLDHRGRTPLFAAVEAVHREAVEALISLGADARIRSRSGAGVLHAFFEDLDAFDPLDAARMLRHLVAAGAKPGDRDAEGRSAEEIARGWDAPWLHEALRMT